MKNKNKNKIPINKLAGLRLKTKAPITFPDRKKQKNKNLCRGAVNERTEEE